MLSKRFAVPCASLALLSLVAPAANAFKPTDGTPPFTGSSTATHSFTVGGFVVKSTSSVWNGATDPSGRALATPVFNGTTATTGGIAFPAAISTGTWSLIDVNSAPPFTVNTTLPSPSTTVTVTGLTGSLTFPSQTRAGGGATNVGLNVDVGQSLTMLGWTASGNVATFIGSTSGTNGVYSTGGQTIKLIGVNAGP